MEDVLYFKIFPDCKIVKGLKSSLIYDVNRHKFYPIENRFADFLMKANGCSVLSIIEENSNSAKIFLDKIVDSEIGFYTREPSLFSEIDFSFKHPSKILSAVVEISDISKYNIREALSKLNRAGCKSLMMIFDINQNVDSTFLSDIFSDISDSFIVSLELAIPFSLKSLFQDAGYLENLRLSNVLIYRAPVVSFEINEYKAQIIETTEMFFSVKEVILPDSFTTNVKMFSEALNFNLGLNRKISISKDGTIRNYLGHQRSYGKIDDVDIDELLLTDFADLWQVSNDKIYKCKDCKYRYCCISNSEIYRKGDVFYKKDYCSYNVNTDVWGETDLVNSKEVE